MRFATGHHLSEYGHVMGVKVKRGLGLLVVAVLAWVTQQALVSHDPPGAVEFALLAAATLCLFAGLVLLAWGLLRE
jgi:hypothetical protein